MYTHGSYSAQFDNCCQYFIESQFSYVSYKYGHENVLIARHECDGTLYIKAISLRTQLSLFLSSVCFLTTYWYCGRNY